jgi:MFS family permease
MGGRGRRSGGAGFGLQTFRALENYNYRFIWLGTLGHAVAMWTDQIAKSWLIWQLTGSPVHLGMINAVRGIPMLIFGILGGVAADRVSRVKILLVCQSVTWATYLVLAFLITTERVAVWHLYVAAVTLGTAMAFNMPTRQSMIPGVVPREMLNNAIGLNIAAMNFTRILGPSMAGVLIAPIGIGGVYWLAGGIYATVLFSTLMLRLPPNLAPRPIQASAWADLKEGFRYVRDTEVILAVLLVGLLPTLLGMPFMALLPAFADTVLGMDASGFGLLMSVSGVGALLGSLWVASVDFKRIGIVMLQGIFAFGALLLAFAIVPPLLVSAGGGSAAVPVAMATLFLIGITNSLFWALSQSTLLSITPEALHGRIMGIRLLEMGVAPMGSALGGFVAQVTSIPVAVALMGITTAGLSLAAGVITPVVRRIEAEPEDVEIGVAGGRLDRSASARGDAQAFAARGFGNGRGPSADGHEVAEPMSGRRPE